jgi:GNAT superfamily N-acetyltransferase
MFLEDLFVREEGRGSGAGGMLFEHVRQLGSPAAAGRLTWNVLVWNSARAGLYHRRGAEWADDWLVTVLRIDHVDRAGHSR